MRKLGRLADFAGSPVRAVNPLASTTRNRTSSVIRFLMAASLFLQVGNLPGAASASVRQLTRRLAERQREGNAGQGERSLLLPFFLALLVQLVDLLLEFLRIGRGRRAAALTAAGQGRQDRQQQQLPQDVGDRVHWII